MSDEAERERARYEALAALVENYRRERDEAREQLYLTKAELGRWVDRETKAARERDEARTERDSAKLTAMAASMAHESIEKMIRFELRVGPEDSLHEAVQRVRYERDEARAEADRWKRSCNVFRERDWPKAFQATVTSLEQEVSDAHEQLAKLRKLSKPWEGDAYRRGAEAMREAAMGAAWHSSAMALYKKIKDLPIPENK